jgi:hypothetical protein
MYSGPMGRGLNELPVIGRSGMLTIAQCCALDQSARLQQLRPC